MARKCELTDNQLRVIADALDHYERYQEDLREDMREDWTSLDLEYLSRACRDVTKEPGDRDMLFGLCV